MKTSETQRDIRRVKVLELRIAGATYRQIHETLLASSEPFMRVKSLRSVVKDEKAILADMRGDIQEGADRHRILVHERYEALFLRWYPVAIGGTADAYRASEMCRKILADQRALWGLDPAEPLVQINQTHVEQTVQVVDAKGELRRKLLRVSVMASRNGDGNHADEGPHTGMDFDTNGRNGSGNDHAKP